MSRCMSDETVKKEYPKNDQRVAVCISKASEDMSLIAAADFKYEVDEFGYTEELTEENFYIPSEDEYESVAGEVEEDWDIATARPGLWENIRRKKEREGKNYKPARTEKEGRPTQEQLKRAQSEHEAYADHAEAEDPRRTPAPKKDQKKGSKKNKPDSAKNPSGKITFSKEVTAQLSKKAADHNAKGKGSKATLGMLKAVYRRGAGAFSTSHAPKMSRHGWAIARVNAFLTLLRTGKPANSAYTQDNDLLPKGHPKKSKAAEYQGRKVKLGKPFLTPKGPKKRSVYVKNDKGNVVKVNFGDPNMKIKKSDPARRKSFRARHKCDSNPGPRWKARYWSCKFW
jgi:hypothetical protein